MVRWEETVCRSLLMESEKPAIFIKFNVDGLLRGDYQGCMRDYTTAKQNSPGGYCIASSQICTMLMDYKGSVTIEIDCIEASAASVIVMASMSLRWCITP